MSRGLDAERKGKHIGVTGAQVNQVVVNKQERLAHYEREKA